MADPYGSNRQSPIPNPTRNPSGEPIPAPGLPDSYPSYLKPIPVNTRDIQKVMRGHLNASEPKIRRWLYSTWGAQREAIKYQELRNAARDGQMPATWLAEWQQEYSTFVNERLAPQWTDTMAASAESLRKAAASAGFEFDALTVERARDWVRYRGGELIVDLSQQQFMAVRNVVQHYAFGPNPVEAEELGRILRPIVGLTPNQARAVRKYRDALIGEGVLKKKEIDNLVGNYAGRLHRVRANRIARTELAFAWNNGQLEKMREVMANGEVRGIIVKEFLTSSDERVCPHCGPLDGQIVGLEETFPGATARLPNLLTPPVHPGCRCSIVYQVVREKDD